MLDESGVNIQRLNSRIPLYKGLRAFTPGDNKAQLYPFFVLYFVYFNIDCLHDCLPLSSSLLQTNTMRDPSKIRHNGDTGVDVQ